MCVRNRFNINSLQSFAYLFWDFSQIFITFPFPPVLHECNSSTVIKHSSGFMNECKSLFDKEKKWFYTVENPFQKDKLIYNFVNLIFLIYLCVHTGAIQRDQPDTTGKSTDQLFCSLCVFLIDIWNQRFLTHVFSSKKRQDGVMYAEMSWSK